MKRIIAPTLAALALAACSESSTAPAASVPEQLRLSAEAPYYSKGVSGIDGDYIVVFKDDVANPLSKADEKIARHAAKAKFRYSATLKGFAATLSPGAVAALQSDPDVAYIEQDGVVTASTTQSGATWGIDRIDQRARPLSGTYNYTSTGSGVRAYIIDTGIQTNHPQFGSRASAVYDALGGSGQDCNGHGTHVAGTVGSSTYGVAKGVMLRAVRVLDCNGSGSNSGVIAGMDWVKTNHISPAVANMSLGGGYSSATNTSANNLAASGVFLAVAAGNSNADACNSSPSSAANATTVAASTSTDARA
jgi:subtilisin family serine protease